MVNSIRVLFLKDKAVRYSFLSRFFSLAIGPVMLFSIGTFLQPEEQGIYYVFGSLMQLAVFVDLGFSKSAQQLLAHGFGPLKFHPARGISGEEAPMHQFLLAAKSIFHIYAFLAVIAFFLLGLAGHIYLKNFLHHSGTNVIYPWWAMIASLSIGIGFQGVTSIADSINLLSLTNKWRLISEIVGLTTFIVTLIIGGGIWATVLLSWLRYGLTIIPISLLLGPIIWLQIRRATGSNFSYRSEILPLQLRNMISYGMGFLIFFCYTPLALSFLGSVAAGIIGMSLQITNIAQGIAIVWFNTKIPLMGNLAGRGSRDDLIGVHRSGMKITGICWITVAGFTLLGATVGKIYLPELSNRYGTIHQITLFILGSGGFAWAHVRAAFMRSYRIEPFAILSIVQASLTVILLICTLPAWGITGAAITYATTMILGAIWTEIAFRKFKNGTHRLSFHQYA